MSYGQIAAALGRPRAAREVGWALRATGGATGGNAGGGASRGADARAGYKVPWWRVINSQGKISIKNNWDSTPEQQRQLLEADGVAVSDNFAVDLNLYRFDPPSNLIEQIKANRRDWC